MKSLYLALALMAANAAYGEIIGTMPIEGGLICDTPEEVLTFLNSNGTELPPGCGRLAIAHVATVHLTKVHEVNGLRFALARYDFIKPGTIWTQYGYWGQPISITATNDTAL